MAGGEAGTLEISLEWPSEDPLITPALSSVNKGAPARESLAEAVSDETALVTGWKTESDNKNNGEDSDKK